MADKEKHAVDSTAQGGGLFLLEVLIDKVLFLKSPCFSDKDFRTCVTISAAGVEPLEICDDDPGACVAKSGGPFVKTFNSGKSCLFSLQEADITKAMNSFPVKVVVHKSLPCGCLPTKIIMGIATIDITKEFIQSRNKFLADPVTVNCQALKDTFQIVAAEGGEHVGDILMFLRISCFGKLIITRFQGGNPSTLGPSRPGSIVDRSCNPQRQFQTTQDPCACGAMQAAGSGKPPPGGGPPCQHGGGHGGGPCPITQDPYNSTPCQDPDDICYCSGPRPKPKQPMVCRNMDQYCLHVPKGVLPCLPIYQDLTEEQIREIKSTNKNLKLLHHFISSSTIAGSSDTFSESTTILDEYSRSFTNTVCFPESIQATLDHTASVGNPAKPYCNKVTTVCVAMFDDLWRRHTSGTQAAASVNKCLQASQSKVGINNNNYNHYVCNAASDTCIFDPSVFASTTQSKQENRIRYSDIYFFGKKKHDKKHKDTDSGVGSKKPVRMDSGQTSRTSSGASVQAQSPKSVQSTSAAEVQAQPPKTTASIQCYTSCGSRKAVSINDRPCPGVVGVTKGDVVATISHIKIGPRELCPIHGKEPCQGPKCIIAASGVNADDNPAVKVSTATNPRRGVFELVIRKLTGAPLARNELMLEWTPPPCRPPTCGSPCPTPCVFTPSCRPSKCKMIVCRPSPCRPSKCYKPPCGVPCRTCCRTSCSGKPCRSCKPCRPCVPASTLCRPCPAPPRCRPRSPCPSSPRCRRPCSPCPPSSRCRACCPPSPRCRPRCRPRPCSPPRCSPPRCFPCPPLPRCRPCPPPRCRPCPPLPRCRPCPPPPRCRPCPPPPRCRPCPPKPCNAPCAQPCGPSPCCNSPCKSSPCLRPCPVGYRKPRRIRCQPKIRAHRKFISPCLNRSKACPMVNCRSAPGPCGGCCGASPCSPSKCCTPFPWKPRKCPVYVCAPRKCGMSPCAPVPCPPLPCPPLPCPSLPCQLMPCPPQKCCTASRYKIKNCCGKGCSNCCS